MHIYIEFCFCVWYLLFIISYHPFKKFLVQSGVNKSDGMVDNTSIS